MRYTKFFAMDIVRRNPKSFLSEKVGLLIIESRILIFKRWLVVYDGLASPGLCITKAITFEKGYHTSEIQLPDIDFQRYCKIR